MNVEYRDLSEEQRSQFVSQTALAFNLRGGPAAVYETVPAEEIRVLVQDGKLVASLRLVCCSQFFGGRSVSTVGLSAVQVPPEARGRGLGKILLSQTFAELKRTCMGISVLYPSSLMFYRNVGYEIAGRKTSYAVPVTALNSKHPEQLTAWDESELDEIRSCYRKYASQYNGLMDLPESWWKKFAFSSRDDSPIYRYLYRKENEIKGFLTFIQAPESKTSKYNYSLVCPHLVWTDTDSANAILSFVRSPGGLVVNLVWNGPVEETLAVFCDQQIGVRSVENWMARLVDLTSALESRGYPKELEAQVEFSVSDPSLPENEGSYCLVVSGGSATLERISQAKIELDVGMLTALYTGWLPAREAVKLGRLRHASGEEVSQLETIFQGSKPWLDVVF